MIKTAIVTGGTGVTGNALVKYLLQQDIKVTALVRPDSFRKRFLPENNENLTIIECGLDDYQSAGGILKNNGYDAFFHLAWDGSAGKEKVDNRNNFRLQNKNVEYAVSAVELCSKISCPVFVMTGSQAEYGRKEKPVTEDMERLPENGYGMAKLCAEGMTRLLCRQYGIKHIWAVLFSVYGPCDATESMIDTTIRGLLAGNTLPYTAGEQKWDYLYSYDAARALLLLAEYGKDGEAYNIANGSDAMHIKDYIKIIYRILAPEKKPRLGEIPYGGGQVMSLTADISKLRNATGFVPEYSFEDGIRIIAESILNEFGKEAHEK